jgi:PKD repeat protein
LKQRMKKLIKPLMFIFFATAIAACSKDTPVEIIEEEGVHPIADFEYISGDDPFTFKFTNKSSEFKEVTWRFGDDSVAYSNDPEHVYMTTGTFQVTITATSESGKTSQSLQEVVIDPNDFLAVTAERSGEQGKLKFKAETAVDVEKVEWRGVDNFRPEPRILSSTSFTPEFEITEGIITPITVTITTKKGSVATVTKDASTEGIVTNFMDAMVDFVPTEDNTGNANENVSKLFDKKDDNKFLLGWAS